MSIQTCEFVSPKHPDKICDHIADSILDAYLALDPHARVAVEVMGGHGAVTVSGEVTSACAVDIVKIVDGIVGPGFQTVLRLSKQSPEIARGVDDGGAGDQGIMIGYATSETANHMPHAYNLARDLCKAVYERFPYDGKTQVTIENGEVTTVVTSFQNAKTDELTRLVRSKIRAREYLINPGVWP
ncbi:MAG: S-adenosylmethionine synthetase N-terminal domain-containing protein [Patescibacteria group bacterium]